MFARVGPGDGDCETPDFAAEGADEGRGVQGAGAVGEAFGGGGFEDEGIEVGADGAAGGDEGAEGAAGQLARHWAGIGRWGWVVGCVWVGRRGSRLVWFELLGWRLTRVEESEDGGEEFNELGSFGRREE